MYQGAMLWGMVPALGFTVLRQFAAARSRPRSAFLVQLAMLVANALGNYVLMFGPFGLPALGLLGAGIASAGANMLGFALMVAIIQGDRDFRRHRLFAHLARLNPARLIAMLRLGVPIAGLFSFEVTLWCGAVYAMGWIGVAELAAHQIAIQCASLTFMVPMGIGQAATVRVGLHAGAGERGGARRAGHVALALSFVFMSVTAIAFILGGEFIARLFLDVTREDAAHAAAIAATLLAIAGVFQVLDGAQAVALGALRGLKDTAIPMGIAAIGYWVIGFPACLILGFTLAMGAPGIWYGLSLGLGVVAVLACWRFERLSRR
jgi:MATE family multidrug resistance protein